MPLRVLNRTVQLSVHITKGHWYVLKPCPGRLRCGLRKPQSTVFVVVEHWTHERSLSTKVTTSIQLNKKKGRSSTVQRHISCPQWFGEEVYGVSMTNKQAVRSALVLVCS
jgi:hypothetical protein